MEPEKFSKQYGEVVKGDHVTYYVYNPKELPFKIEYNSILIKNLSEANNSIGNLNGAGHLLKNPHLLISPYLRKEAVLSSKIEGTRTTLSEVFINENKNKKEESNQDLREVLNYIDALEYGLKEIEKRSISLDLIKELHKILLSGTRGEGKNPGEFRDNQNWIGNEDDDMFKARFVPPSSKEVPHLMENLIKFLNEEEKECHLLKSAIMHYQFETIHPFRDGNGRIGRLLIILYFCKNKILFKPLLYLSAYFEKNREKYQEKLYRVSKEGELNEWINYFLEGINVQSKDALERAIKLENYREECRLKLQSNYRNNTALTVLDLFFESPFLRIPAIKDKVGNYPKAVRAIKILEENKIITRFERNKVDKIFYSPKIKEILDVH